MPEGIDQQLPHERRLGVLAELDGRHGARSDRVALLELAASYHERRTTLLGLEDLGGQLTKVYAIEAPGRIVTLDTWEHALHLATDQLCQDLDMGSLGLGCVILHAGGDGDYLLVHSWVEGYMSRLAIFTGPMRTPKALRPASVGLAPCVWEAAVLAHERDAYVRHVLAGTGPLDQRLRAWGADVFAVSPRDN
jgi:hypothetical protein